MVLNKALTTIASVGPNTARSEKGDDSQILKGIRSTPKTSIIPAKNAGNEDVTLFALLLLSCKWTVLTKLSSITHEVEAASLQWRIFKQFAWAMMLLTYLSCPAKLNLLIMIIQVLWWEQKVKHEKHQSGLMASEIDLAWSFLWNRPLTWKQPAQICFVKWRRDLETCLNQY